MRKRTEGAGRPVDLELRERVLRISFQLLREKKNLRTITIDEIASSAEASKATIYKQWSSKSALFVDCFFHAVNTELAFDKKMPPLEALRKQFLALGRILGSEDGEVLRAFIAESCFDDEVRKALQEQYFLPRRKAAIAFMRGAIEQNAISSSTRPEIAVDALYGAYFYALMTGFRTIDEEWCCRIFDAVVNGLARRD